MGLFKDCGCGCNGKKQEKKFLISLMSALIFFIISNADTYRLTRSVIGKWIAGANGCPTTMGLILHSIVFMLVTWGIMQIKKEEYAIIENTQFKEVVTPTENVEKIPSMAKMPDPKPGMNEKQYGINDVDDMNLGSIDLSENDAVNFSNGKAVTCSCNDGSNVLITP